MPNRTAPRAHTLSLITSLVLLGTMASQALASVPDLALPNPDSRRSHLRCDLQTGICLLTDADADSDGDGWSDADEKALGTDPDDPSSTPTVGRYLDRLREVNLPSFANGRTTIFVPPTRAPNGASLAGLTGQLSIEGTFGFPVRRDALTRLGISEKALAAAGIDLGLGATIRFGDDPRGGDGSIRIGGSGLPARVGGMRTSSIAAGASGFDPVSVMSGFTSNVASGPNAGKPIVDVRADGKGVQATFADGSKDLSVTTKTDMGTNVTHVAFAPDGSRSSERSTTTTTTPLASGGSITTVTNSTTTANPDGSKTTDTNRRSKTVDAKGNTTSSSSDVSRTVTKPDGSSRTIATNTANQGTGEGGSEQKVSTTVTDRDSNGKTTSTVTTTTTTTTSGSGDTTTKTSTSCSGASENNCPASGYVNPDAEFEVVILSPAQVEQTLRMIGGVRTNSGSTVRDELDLDRVTNPRDPGPIALYDPEAMSFVLVTTPTIYTRGPVPDNYGPDGLPKGEDLDPKTLELPGSGAADRAAADAFMQGLGQLPGMPR